MAAKKKTVNQEITVQIKVLQGKSMLDSEQDIFTALSKAGLRVTGDILESVDTECPFSESA